MRSRRVPQLGHGLWPAGFGINRDLRRLPGRAGATRRRRGPPGGGRGRIERGHERGLATVFGPVTVRRLAYRAPRQPNICTADAALSLPARQQLERFGRCDVFVHCAAAFDQVTLAGADAATWRHVQAVKRIGRAPPGVHPQQGAGLWLFGPAGCRGSLLCRCGTG